MLGPRAVKRWTAFECAKRLIQEKGAPALAGRGPAAAAAPAFARLQWTPRLPGRRVDDLGREIDVMYIGGRTQPGTAIEAYARGLRKQAARETGLEGLADDGA